MIDWPTGLMLVVAALLIVVTRVRPQGKNVKRSNLALAGVMAVMAIFRLAEPVGALRMLLLATQAALALAAIGFTVLRFRGGELSGARKNP